MNRMARIRNWVGLTTGPASPEGYGRTGWPSILILIVIMILIENSTTWRREWTTEGEAPKGAN